MNNELSYTKQRVDKDAMKLLDSAQDASNNSEYNAGLIESMLTMLTSTHKKMLQTSSFRNDDVTLGVLTVLALQKEIIRQRSLDNELNTTDDREEALGEIIKKIDYAISVAQKEVDSSQEKKGGKCSCKTKRKKTKKKRSKKKKRKSKKKKRTRRKTRRN